MSAVLLSQVAGYRLSIEGTHPLASSATPKGATQLGLPRILQDAWLSTLDPRLGILHL